MTRLRAVLDASVLYQEPIRSLLLWIAAEGGYEPCWSERILEETERSLLGGSAVTSDQWKRLRGAMSAAFPDAMLDQDAVDAIEDEMPNHEKDRHVLAAAVVGGIELIVTTNLRHFAVDDLAPSASAALAQMPFCASSSIAPLTSSAPRWISRSPTCASRAGGRLPSSWAGWPVREVAIRWLHASQ